MKKLNKNLIIFIVNLIIFSKNQSERHPKKKTKQNKTKQVYISLNNCQLNFINQSEVFFAPFE
jgi:hypothetical protein